MLPGALLPNAGLRFDSSKGYFNSFDILDSNANSGELAFNQLSGLDMAGSISYTGVEELNIGLSSGGDTFTIQRGAEKIAARNIQTPGPSSPISTV